MNVQDIVTRVRRKFGDEAAVQITDEDIIRWINDSQIEIVKNNDGALQTTGFINVVANQGEYPLPADLFILRSLRYKSPSMTSYMSLRYINLQQFDEVLDGWDGSAYSTGNAKLYTKYDDKIILFPLPSAAMTQGIKVLYNSRPTDVTGLMDTLSLPEIYHSTVEKYCMWQASLLDEDNEPALMYKNDFQEDIRVLNFRETREATATYPRITTLEDDL